MMKSKLIETMKKAQKALVWKRMKMIENNNSV
jgi:hypothetical protein